MKMEEIWKKLPNDLAFHILYFTDIDTRRAFGLKPQRNRLPIFDFKMKPLIWTERYQHFYCDIRKDDKCLTGKVIHQSNKVYYLFFTNPTSWVLWQTELEYLSFGAAYI